MNEEIEDDPFADDEDVLAYRKEQAEYDEMLNECSVIFCKEFNLAETEEGPEISSFEIPKSLEKINTIYFFGSSDRDNTLTILLAEFQWFHNSPKFRSEDSDHCLFGYINLNKEFPQTFIYKETVKERIVNWFVKGDIDFKEHKKFSRNFHVVTKDKEKLTFLIGNKPLDILLPFPDMQIEISGTKCMFRVSQNTISIEETNQFVLLTKAMLKIFS